MNALLNKAIFNENQSMLKETSKDSANDLYMTQSMLPVIDFDGVKGSYIKGLQLEETPKSNDVLYLSTDGELFFIEFKNGDMKKEIYNIKRKIYDSLLILTDIIEKGVSFTRENMHYILVYNKENSKKIIESKKKELTKNQVQESEGLTCIQSSLSRLGKYNFDYFGIRKQFKGLYFKEVYTYTIAEFECEFLKKIKPPE